MASTDITAQDRAEALNVITDDLARGRIDQQTADGRIRAIGSATTREEMIAALSAKFVDGQMVRPTRAGRIVAPEPTVTKAEPKPEPAEDDGADVPNTVLGVLRLSLELTPRLVVLLAIAWLLVIYASLTGSPII